MRPSTPGSEIVFSSFNGGLNWALAMPKDAASEKINRFMFSPIGAIPTHFRLLRDLIIVTFNLPKYEYQLILKT
jgi:hypothetical protein